MTATRIRMNPCMHLFPLATVISTAAVSFAQDPCAQLRSLSLPNTTITAAEPVAATLSAPAPCRVAAILVPSADSHIEMEAWLPAPGWNGKFQAVGNGGWAGVISYPAMAQAVERGYDTTSTDTGHVGATGSFALGHPEKLTDFGYRAVHEMTVTAKAVVAAFYGDPPKISYWNGCSTGGRQGLKEAQRFPDDYDAIIAGASANPRTHLSTWQIWLAQGILKDAPNYIPASKYPVIHKAVLEAGDAPDGLKDGLLNDPPLCHFDPKVIECKEGDAATCLPIAPLADP